jgi:adenylate cyclase class IV
VPAFWEGDTASISPPHRSTWSNELLTGTSGGLAGSVPTEAEIKARVRDRQRLIAALEERGTGVPSTYHDRYFDLPDRRWTRDGHEPRVRTVVAESGATRTVVRSVLAELGIPPEDFTTEQYTEAVAARRGQD